MRLPTFGGAVASAHDRTKSTLEAEDSTDRWRQECRSVNGAIASGPTGDGRRAGTSSTDIRRFQAEEQRTLAGLAGWIGHPAIPGIIKDAAPLAAAAVTPIRKHLTDPEEVIAFSWFVMDIAAVLPGWSVPSHIWQLSPAELIAMDAVKAKSHAVVVATADKLTMAGASLVTSWPGDLAVVAELLLLEVIGVQIPWDADPHELADLLQPPPNSAIELDASGTKVRRGTSERGERDATGLRRGYETHLFGRQPTAPYAQGGTRAAPESTLQRRVALRKVIKAFPDITINQIRQTYQQRDFKADGTPATPGGYLRALLGDAMRCPAKSTLAADIKKIQQDCSGESAEEVSE